MPTETPVLTRKVFDPVETHFTPGERSMVAWITTDAVDHEKDVVVAAGVDYKTFFLGKTADAGNPCVFAVHDYGRWPLGKCEWIKAKHSREFNGLYAKTILDEDAEAETVWRKIKSRTLRGISIGFRPPDDLKAGEWGPPTREELARRPDWKGAQRVIRRCVLLEYSVCGLPMNPQALVTAISKGVHIPVYEGTKAMDEPEELEDKGAACECGKADCEKCSPADKKPVETKAEDEGPPKEEASDEDDFDEADESALPIKTGDHVDVKCKGLHGCGRVEKIHRKGMVEHVDEDMIGTKDDPAARVRLYKAHGDGHRASETRIAAKLKSLTRRAEPFKEPSKKVADEVEAKTEDSPIGEKSGPLPPLVCLSDTEIAQKALAQINDIPALVQREIFRITGVV